MAFLNAFRVFTVIFLVIAVYFAGNDPAVERARQKDSVRRAPVAYFPPASQCTKTGRIALTFNNGISLTNTPVVLDVLKASNTQVTFYISPEWVGRLQLVDALLRRMYAEGHTLGFHWWGDDPRELTETDLRTKLIEQSTKIYNAVGVHPRFMRFPYDKLNQQVAGVANNLGLVLSSWNVDPADYQMCDGYTRTYPYSASNITSAYLSQFNLFKDAGNLQSSFIGLHTDLCPIAPAIGNLIRLTQEYKYDLVSIATCLGEVASYRKAADLADPLLPSETSSTSTTPGAGPTARASFSEGQSTSSSDNRISPWVVINFLVVMVTISITMF